MITNINLTLESQIWLELSCFPNTRFGGVYNPPDSSPYYEQSIIGNVYAQTNAKESAVVLGDFNARVGKPDILDHKGKNMSMLTYVMKLKMHQEKGSLTYAKKDL